MNSSTGIKEAVIAAIKELAYKYDIEKVILFGSRARGDYHRICLTKEKYYDMFCDLRKEMEINWIS